MLPPRCTACGGSAAARRDGRRPPTATTFSKAGNVAVFELYSMTRSLWASPTSSTPTRARSADRAAAGTERSKVRAVGVVRVERCVVGLVPSPRINKSAQEEEPRAVASTCSTVPSRAIAEFGEGDGRVVFFGHDKMRLTMGYRDDPRGHLGHRPRRGPGCDPDVSSGTSSRTRAAPRSVLFADRQRGMSTKAPSPAASATTRSSTSGQRRPSVSPPMGDDNKVVDIWSKVTDEVSKNLISEISRPSSPS